MQAIHRLKQNDLFLIENTKTKKVFVASDVDGEERICEHDHDKKKFEKHYKAWDGKDKPCEKCYSNNNKRSKIQVKFGDLAPDAQNAVHTAANLFFPCFDTKDFLFFLEVRANLLKWVYSIKENVFIIDTEGDDEVFQSQTVNTIEAFFGGMTDLYNRDFRANNTMAQTLSIYLYIKDEVTQRIQLLDKNIKVDLLSEDEILSILIRQSTIPFQYTNNRSEYLDYFHKVFVKMYKHMSFHMNKLTATIYEKFLPNIKIPYRPQKFQAYFRTNSMLKMIAEFLVNRGVHFNSLFVKINPSFKINDELFAILKKAKKCSNFNFFSEVRNNLATYLKLKNTEETALLFSLNTPEQIQEFEKHKQQQTIPELNFFRVPVVQIQYKQHLYDEDEGNKLIETKIVNKQFLLDVYGVFFNLSLFGDDGILMSDYYKNSKEYSNITVEII